MRLPRRGRTGSELPYEGDIEFLPKIRSDLNTGRFAVVHDDHFGALARVISGSEGPKAIAEAIGSVAGRNDN